MKACGTDMVCCQFKEPDPDNINIDGIFTTPKCGLKGVDVNSRITLDAKIDQEADPGEFPWMILVLKKKNSVYEKLCGGTLIKENGQ